VLIRGVQPVSGEQAMRARGNGRPYPQLSNGPGKLTRAMGITRAGLNRHDLCRGRQLWVARGDPVTDQKIIAGPRVGIAYAASGDRDAPLRFRIGMDPVRLDPRRRI
jgi:DNA-3-methyladenine glycosylase